MTPTPTDRIMSALLAADYRSVSPLELAGLSFDFPAAFMGDERSLDLILVADLAFDEPKRLLQRVESVARTLDVMRSKRPITLVLAGPKPNRDVLDAMSRVCRVLPITSGKSEDADAVDGRFPSLTKKKCVASNSERSSKGRSMRIPPI
jgi:hypothetical protein